MSKELLNNEGITLRIEETVNRRLAIAESIMKDTIQYLRKNRCYLKADELQLAFIELNKVDIEAK
jgi:hypothetical protein